jgi:hypothetical protein
MLSTNAQGRVVQDWVEFAEFSGCGDSEKLRRMGHAGRGGEQERSVGGKGKVRVSKGEERKLGGSDIRLWASRTRQTPQRVGQEKAWRIRLGRRSSI